MKKLLFIGAGGLIGKYFIQIASKDFSITATYLKHDSIPRKNNVKYIKLDLTKRKNVLNVVHKIKPDTIVLAASIGDIDYCEKHKSQAYQVNYLGVKNISDGIRNTSIKLIFLSTSYVYLGRKKIYRESDKLCPLNYYGYTKTLAEKYITKNNNHYVILRLSTMYGWNYKTHRQNIATNLIKQAGNNNKIYVVRDRYTNFLYAGDAATCLKKVIKKNINYTILNIAGERCISYYEFALMLCKYFSIETEKIIPAESNFFNNLTPRPRNTCLDCTQAEAIIKFHPMSISNGLSRMKHNKDD